MDPHLLTHCRDFTVPATAPICLIWGWGLKQPSGSPLASTAGSMILCETHAPGYAMLMSPNQDKTAVHGCHSTGNRLRACVQVLARPWRCYDIFMSSHVYLPLNWWIHISLRIAETLQSQPQLPYVSYGAGV